jgi:hypothetical protein
MPPSNSKQRTRNQHLIGDTTTIRAITTTTTISIIGITETVGTVGVIVEVIERGTITRVNVRMQHHARTTGGMRKGVGRGKNPENLGRMGGIDHDGGMMKSGIRRASMRISNVLDANASGHWGIYSCGY